MPRRFGVLFDEWKDADAAASAAQRQLFDVLKSWSQGASAPPTEEQERRAEDLREKERQALTALLRFLEDGGDVR